MWRPHNFSSGVAGRTLAGGSSPRHENRSRERCGSRASSPHLFFHDRMNG